jgi:hypothetical protein
LIVILFKIKIILKRILKQMKKLEVCVELQNILLQKLFYQVILTFFFFFLINEFILLDTGHDKTVDWWSLGAL